MRYENSSQASRLLSFILIETFICHFCYRFCLPSEFLSIFPAKTGSKSIEKHWEEGSLSFSNLEVEVRGGDLGWKLKFRILLPLKEHIKSLFSEFAEISQGEIENDAQLPDDI